MKNLISLIVVLLIGWVVYVTFFGTAEDKVLRDKLFSGVKDTGKTVGEIFKSEKGKYQKGMYDKEITQINTLIETLSNNEEAAKKDGMDYSAELEELRARKERMEDMIDTYDKVQAAAEEGQLSRTKAPSEEELKSNFKSMKETLDKIEQKLGE